MEAKITLPATAGGAGISTANAQSERPLRGRLIGIAFTRTGTVIPATTDIFIDEVGGAGRRLFTLTNLGADPGVYYPLQQGQDTSGAAIAGAFEPIYIPGYYVKVTIQQCNDGTVLVARLWLDDTERRSLL